MKPCNGTFKINSPAHRPPLTKWNRKKSRFLRYFIGFYQKSFSRKNKTIIHAKHFLNFFIINAISGHSPCDFFLEEGGKGGVTYIYPLTPLPLYPVECMMMSKWSIRNFKSFYHQLFKKKLTAKGGYLCITSVFWIFSMMWRNA